MTFVVGDRGDAVEMVVQGPWSQEAEDAIVSGRVDRLVLNYMHGFDEPSLAFLRGLPVRELVVLDRRLTDLSPVHTLGATLTALHVTTDPAADIDLQLLPRLTRLGAAWTQVRRTIHAGPQIRDAFLRGYEETDLRPLGRLVRLVALSMKERPRLRSLEGLQALPDLQSLGVYLAADLADIEALAGRSVMEKLELESCRKITRLDAITGLRGLRHLNVSECGDIDTLAPLRGLTQLESVSLYGSTKVLDGDLSPLLDLPGLRSLRMQSRRFYRPSVQDVQATL